MGLDKYVVGFVFGMAVGAAIASPGKDVPRPVPNAGQKQMYEVRSGPPQELIKIQQDYKPADKNYLFH